MVSYAILFTILMALLIKGIELIFNTEGFAAEDVLEIVDNE